MSGSARDGDLDELFTHVFSRAYRVGRRWDEGLWRYHELAAVSRLLVERPQLLQGPILDLGCGDGEVFGWIFGHRADASGVDPGTTRNDDIVRARLAGCYSDVRQEDGSRMSFADDHFRLVFSNSVVEHIRPVEPVLREVQRVLQPGGRFLFTTPAPRLYSRDTYQWRRVLGPIGLDWLGRRIARRENDAYHHVSILDFQTWRTKLEAVGFVQVEQQTYLPVAVARVLTGFSGAIRQPLLRRHAWRLSREARALSAPAVITELQWIESSREILAPLLQPVPDSNQCGQLLLATNGEG
jgi:SAM-dependent methyltransferase